jgi:hypothetical protein
MKKIVVFSLVFLLGLGHFAFASTENLCMQMPKAPAARTALNALRDCCRSTAPCGDCAIKDGSRLFERIAAPSSSTSAPQAVSKRPVISSFSAPPVPAARHEFFRPPAPPGAVLSLYSVFRI